MQTLDKVFSHMLCEPDLVMPVLRRRKLRPKAQSQKRPNQGGNQGKSDIQLPTLSALGNAQPSHPCLLFTVSGTYHRPPSISAASSLCHLPSLTVSSGESPTAMPRHPAP